MAITKFKETRRSKEQSVAEGVKKARREYRLWYATGADEAEAYLAINLPTSIVSFTDTLYITNLEMTPDDRDNRVFTVAADYSTDPPADRSEVGTETVSFDLASQTVKTKVSPLTVSNYTTPGEPALNFKGGIGWNGENFEGADRFVEAFSFSVTKILANAAITNSYIKAIRDTAFRWNSTVFRGHAPGECLFVGAGGAPRDSKTYSVTFKFLGSSNASGLSFGDISGVSKQGWDYLWTFFDSYEDTTAHYITSRPRSVHIERLYTSANFVTNLGLSSG